MGLAGAVLSNLYGNPFACEVKLKPYGIYYLIYYAEGGQARNDYGRVFGIVPPLLKNS